MFKKKNKYKKTAVILLLIIFFIFSLKIIFFFKKEYENKVWKDKTNLILLIISQDVFLAVYNTFYQRIYLIKIPESVLSLFDKEVFLSLPKNNQLEQKMQDKNKQLISSVENFFGIFVDGEYKNNDLSIEKFNINFFDIVSNKTNLTIFDYFKIKSVNLITEKINLSEIIPNKKHVLDKEKFKIFYKDQIDNKFSKIFKDKQLSSSNLFFKIIFYGKQDNFEYVKRLVSNIGWKLSDYESIDTNSLKKNKCVLKNKLKIENFLKKIINCDIEYNNNVSYDVVLEIK